MEKLKLHTPDLTQENIAKLAELLPSCVTESMSEDGSLKRGIDFDQLRQELSDSIVEGPQERYQLTWPGKKDALILANAPTAKTLRPCREESVDFDTTKNLFIEGDNLDALKLLQETYLNKVKLIYIDPPYNTGNDFIYKDDFSEDADIYLERSNQKDELGIPLITNTESNGRFHSDWLSMMYSRLRLSRNLLSTDGVIFISIDDGEVHNLRKLCDEIFGASNFVGCIVRATGQTTGQDSGGLGSSFDYLISYSKSPNFNLDGLPLNEGDLKRFENEDSVGKYAFDQMRKTGSNDKREDRPNMYYSVEDPDGNLVFPIGPTGYESRWRFELKTYKRLVSENFILWKKTKRNDRETWWPYVKYYLEGRTKRPSPLWNDIEGNKKAARDLREIFNGIKLFDFPKPIQLIKRIVSISCGKNDIVLDFFSGSSTTAHSVMQLNAEDGGNRKFIMVQLPEVCDEKSEAYNAGYKTIAEIGKERIRRAGNKIKSDNSNKENVYQLDSGFRVLKVDSSNMKDVYYSPDVAQQSNLLDQVSNIKDDRTSEDLLFQVLLDWGVNLSWPINHTIIAGKQVFFVDGNAIAACFESGINEEFVKILAARHPLRVVFRDSSFDNDSVKINVEQIFKLISPATEVKTI